MDKIFVPLYRYFEKHKPLMYAIMVITAVVFVFFGLKVQYEEDLTKLLPASDSDTELAFGNLRVKDKIFIQVASRDSLLDTDTLGEYVDEFVESLIEKDSADNRIANVLYYVNTDMAVDALDFALSHVPTFVDPSSYDKFDELMEPDAIDAQMERNFQIVMDDWTGSATQMVASDPFAFRYAMLESITGVSAASMEDITSMVGGASGFTMVDGHLFCADSTVALAFLAPNFTSFDSKSGSLLVETLENEVASFEASHPDVKILFHGAPVRSAFNSRQIKSDLVLTIALSLLVILLALCICYKSFSIIWQLILPVGYGAFFALAGMYALKGGMSLMALGIGAVVLGVAISYCLHVLTHYKFTGDGEQMLKDEATPVVLGCITTIGAFLGLLFTKSDLLKDFGIFSSLALVGNTLYALIFLPHFLKKGDTSKNEKAFSLITKINDYPYDRKKPLLAAVVLVIVVGCIFSGKVRFDSDLQNLNFNEPKVHESETLYAQKNNAGMVNMYYAATAPTLDEALEYNKGVSEVMDSLYSEGVVTSGSSLVTKMFVPVPEQEARIAAWNSYWSLEKIEKARKAISSSAKRNGLDPSMFESFFALVQSEYEPASLYNAGIIPESLLSNFMEQSADGKWLVFTSTKMDASSKKLVGDKVSAREHAIVVDPFYYTNDMIRVIHDDFTVTLAISSLFVLFVLLVSFMNIWTALIAFMPMAFSWYVVQGIMAIFGLEFNLINIIISTFIFGIGVDYSIFVMQGLLAEAREGDANMLSYHKVAIFFSAFVLVVVVLSLLVATHPAITSIGVSTLIGMASTILITYTLQPLLFRILLGIPFFRKSILKK